MWRGASLELKDEEYFACRIIRNCECHLVLLRVTLWSFFFQIIPDSALAIAVIGCLADYSSLVKVHYGGTWSIILDTISWIWPVSKLISFSNAAVQAICFLCSCGALLFLSQSCIIFCATNMRAPVELLLLPKRSQLHCRGSNSTQQLWLWET